LPKTGFDFEEERAEISRQNGVSEGVDEERVLGADGGASFVTSMEERGPRAIGLTNPDLQSRDFENFDAFWSAVESLQKDVFRFLETANLILKDASTQ
jgi:hypothetical protein